VRWLLALVGVGLATLAAALILGSRSGSGGGGGEPPAATATRERPSDADALDALLAARGRALSARNAGALARTTAPGPMRAADRRRVARLRGLRLASMRYVPTDVTFDRRRARIVAFETYRVRGVPDSLFSVRRTYRAAKGRNGWRLTGERLGSERQPWELSRLRQERGRHFVIIAPRELGVATASLEPALERAYAALRRAGLGRPAARYLVVVAKDTEEGKRLATHISGLESLVAVADTDVREEGIAQRPATIVSSRLILMWPTYLRLDGAGQQMILEHELTHLVTAPVTSGRTPAWLVEGLALYVSGDRRVAEAARDVSIGAAGGGSQAAHRVLTLTALSRPGAIARLDGPGQGAAYAYASAAAFYIGDRFGRRALLHLYRVFADESLTGKPGATLVDAAVRRVLHEPLVRLERDLRRWIVTRAVVAPLAP
jgi:hypothetical protein